MRPSVSVGLTATATINDNNFTAFAHAACAVGHRRG